MATVEISTFQKWTAFVISNSLFGAGVVATWPGVLPVLLVASLFNLLFLVSDRVFRFRASEDGVEIDVSAAVAGFEEEVTKRHIREMIAVRAQDLEDQFRGVNTTKQLTQRSASKMFDLMLEAMAERRQLDAERKQRLFQAEGLAPALDELFREE